MRRATVIVGWGPRRRSGEFAAIYVGEPTTLGHDDDGRLAGISLNAERDGAAINEDARDSAAVASVALRREADADTLTHGLMRSGSGVLSGHLGVLLDPLGRDGT